MAVNIKNTLLKEANKTLKSIYGDRLDKVILFGSYARGEASEDSDIDLLVVLKDDTILTGKEIRYINQSLFDIGFNYSVSISAHPVSSRRYQSEKNFFLNRVRKEGVIL